VPAFSSPHQNDTDNHSRDAKGIYKPAKSLGITFKEWLSDCEMNDKNDLKGESPDNK
jgi:hypothetical protein